MKCQKCNRPATEHITEILEKGKVLQLHFCEKHAREYVAQVDLQAAKNSTAWTQATASPEAAPQPPAVEIPGLDTTKACPVCGLTLGDFRQKGRFGCPHDYEAFATELEDLLLAIHGASEHHGKRPRRGGSTGTSRRTQLIRLRQDMQQAIAAEDYELASQLRDRMKELENM